MTVTKYEMETIINFNEEDGMATVYTHNKSLIRKLAGFHVKETDRIEDAVTFVVPKEWIRIRPPRKLNISTEAREELSLRAKKNFKVMGDEK